MPVEKIIVNASPLILLFNSELDFILPEIFEEIAVPDAVWKEITDSGGSDKASQMIADTRWIKRVSVKPVEDVVRWDLGAGETEVLSFFYFLSVCVCGKIKAGVCYKLIIRSSIKKS